MDHWSICACPVPTKNWNNQITVNKNCCMYRDSAVIWVFTTKSCVANSTKAAASTGITTNSIAFEQVWNYITNKRIIVKASFKKHLFSEIDAVLKLFNSWLPFTSIFENAALFWNILSRNGWLKMTELRLFWQILVKNYVCITNTSTPTFAESIKRDPGLPDLLCEGLDNKRI